MLSFIMIYSQYLSNIICLLLLTSSIISLRCTNICIYRSYCPWNCSITNISIIQVFFSYYRILKHSMFFFSSANYFSSSFSKCPSFRIHLAYWEHSFCSPDCVWTTPSLWSLILTTFIPVSSPYFSSMVSITPTYHCDYFSAFVECSHVKILFSF